MLCTYGKRYQVISTTQRCLVCMEDLLEYMFRESVRSIQEPYQ